jgi:hypothetical protein
MQSAEIGTYGNSSLPAFCMLALVDPLDLGPILAEVQSLAGMNFCSDCFMKVVVCDDPVLIVVEHVEHAFELLVCEIQTPMLEVESKFILCNG